MISTPFGKDKDLQYMQQAFAQARKAFERDEVPVGALVVNERGIIVARSYNCVERMHSQSAHAEIRALAKATKKLGDWRLERHWLYVTLEPCSMCMGLITLSRIEGVIFAAASPLFGYRLDKDNALQLYKRDTVQIIEGIGREESVELLKNFFQKRRKKRE